MAASKTIGGINVTISATYSKFTKGISICRRMAGQFVRSVKGMVFSLKGLTAALTVGAFVKFTANQFEAIAALGDLSDKLGVSTEKLAGYQHAASEAGISNTVLEKSLTTLGAKGLTLRGWIEETSKLTTHQQKLAASVEMFGARGASMVRFLTGGTKALDEAQRAAESLGLALDRKTVAGVDRAGEAFARFKTAVSGIFRSLAAEIAPFVEVLSDKATSFLATNGRGKGIGASIANAIIEMTKFVADAIQKMVQGVLGFISDAKGLMLQFRLDAPAWLGVGFKGDKAKQNAFAGFDASRKAYGRSLGWELPSVGIEKLMADARKKAAEQAALSPASRGNLFSGARGLLGGMLGSTGGQNAQQLGGKLWEGIAKGIQAVPGLMAGAQWAGMQHFGANFKRGGVGSFAMVAGQDPLSREGNAQRVRSLAQNPAMKIGQKQLDKQTKMERHLEKIARNPPINLKPANI